MDSDISHVGPDERLVCYFEDGSFSVIPSSAMVPFSPEKEPFLSYVRNIRRFTNDLGVMRAVRFWESAQVPEGFKWLAPASTGSETARGQREAVAETKTAPISPTLHNASPTKKGRTVKSSMNKTTRRKVSRITMRTTPRGGEKRKKRETTTMTTTASAAAESLASPSPAHGASIVLRSLTLRKRFDHLAHLLPKCVINTRIF